MQPQPSGTPFWRITTEREPVKIRGTPSVVPLLFTRLLVNLGGKNEAEE